MSLEKIIDLLNFILSLVPLWHKLHQKEIDGFDMIKITFLVIQKALSHPERKKKSNKSKSSSKTENILSGLNFI